jgi:hypothetical protein
LYGYAVRASPLTAAKECVASRTPRVIRTG